MEDHKEIWLEPDCCADHAGFGRTWCQDGDVWDTCEDHNEPTKYVRADLYESLLTENGELNAKLDKIHSLAVTMWGDGDGWLKVMQIADPGARATVEGKQR